MTLKLTKVRGKSDQFVFTYDNGTKVVAWQVDGNDVDTETLTDVVDTVHPVLAPTIPQFPVTMPPEMYIPQEHLDTPFRVTGSGEEAADKAAREEEMRLRNMGGALRTGINMAANDIPVFDDGGMPEVNWSV